MLTWFGSQPEPTMIISTRPATNNAHLNFSSALKTHGFDFYTLWKQEANYR
jgi:hypothetical protein